MNTKAIRKRYNRLSVARMKTINVYEQSYSVARIHVLQVPKNRI